MPRSCDFALNRFWLTLGDDVQRPVLLTFLRDPSCSLRVTGDAGLNLRDRLGQAQQRKPSAAGGALVNVDSAHQTAILARGVREQRCSFSSRPFAVSVRSLLPRYGLGRGPSDEGRISLSTRYSRFLAAKSPRQRECRRGQSAGQYSLGRWMTLLVKYRVISSSGKSVCAISFVKTMLPLPSSHVSVAVRSGRTASFQT